RARSGACRALARGAPPPRAYGPRTTRRTSSAPALRARRPHPDLARLGVDRAPRDAALRPARAAQVAAGRAHRLAPELGLRPIARDGALEGAVAIVHLAGAGPVALARR